MKNKNKVLYAVNNNFITNEPLESIDINELDSVFLYEYIGFYYDMNDVVKTINLITKEMTYVAPGDEYAGYHYELNYPDTPYPWEEVKGNLKHIYEEFIKEGVKLTTKKYGKPSLKQKKLKLFKITSPKD